MFCSKCKNCSKLKIIRRRICSNGHVLCGKCDAENSRKCPICKAEFKNIVQVEISNGIPSLSIVENPEETAETPELNKKTDSEIILEHLKEYQNHNSSDQHKKKILSSFAHSTPSRKSSVLEYERPPSSFSSQVLSEIAPFEEHNNIIYYNGKPAYSITNRPSDDPETSKFQSLEYEKISVSNDSEKIQYVRIRHDKHVGDVAGSSHDGIYSGKSSCESKETSPSADKSTKGSSITLSDLAEYYKNNDVSDESKSPNFTSPNSSAERKTPSPPSKFNIPAYTYAARSKFSTKKSFDDSSFEAQYEPLCYYENGGSPTISDDLCQIERNLSRGPVICPITFCEKLSVPSDYCNHISVDHPYVPLRRIYPGITANFEINLKGDKLELCRSQMLFLVSNKISDLGYGDFADCLPVSFMTSTVNLKNMTECKSNDPKTLRRRDCYYLLWLLGIYEYPLTFTLTLWSHEQNRKAPRINKTLTNSVNFINHRKSLYELFSAGNVFKISQVEMDLLTNNFQDPLKCQITIH